MSQAKTGRHFDPCLILAFYFFRKRGGIAKLLDVEDMVRMRNPDWKCVFTYVQQFYRKYRDGLDTPTTPTSPVTPVTPTTPTTPEVTIQASN